MDSGDPSEGTQLWGIIWSFIAVYGVWVALVALLVAAVVGFLFMMRDRQAIEKKRTTGEV